MNALFPLRPLAAAIAALAAANGFVTDARADACCAAPEPVVVVVEQPIIVEQKQPSWIFARSTFTNDPVTGARVAQYMRKRPVEPLDDPRAITSRYRRTRTNIRGADGSYESDYQVQAWGNGRGGLDAEWERFHDAWKESYLTGGYYRGPGYGGYPAYGGGYPGYGGGYPGYGYGAPGSGYVGPAYGAPGYGVPPHGYPPGGPGPGGSLPHQGQPVTE